MRLGHLALLGALATGADALWPFKPKRFTAEAFLDAGSLGLDDAVRGRVLAIGDVNGDQNSDLFVLDQDGSTVHVYLWQRDNFKYVHASSIPFPHDVVNVVPADFNGDGRLDLLAMMSEGANGGNWWSGSGAMNTDMQVVIAGAGGLVAERWTLDPANEAQPIMYDDDGSLRSSLLGFIRTDTGPQLHSWRNNGTGMPLSRSLLYPDENVCQLALPHSSAFVDLDGDCQPDLVLHCKHASANEGSLQVWTSRGESGYIMSKRIDLPKGTRSVTFADMNRDGALDLVMTSCKKALPSSGVGTDCHVHIAYNIQVGVCSSETSRYDEKGRLQCRGWGELCLSDPSFDFDMFEGSEYYTTFAIQDLFPDDDVELLVSVPGTKDIPLSLRAGDMDVNGFPDLLATVKSGGETWVKVLRNVPCKKGMSGCDKPQIKGARGFVVGSGKGYDALDRITDAVGASWLDLDDDGSLDIMVQRTGKQDGKRVTFIQNNFYHDAFFLKAQVLNGACEGNSCQAANDTSGNKWSGLGASYSGAQFKFTVFDTGGTRHAQQVPQLPQTCYQSLHSPHTFIGLGRTNNYIENLFVGTSLWEDATYMLESLIPNSQVIVNPPWPGKGDKNPPVAQRSKEWRVELFLHPGDWVPWVAAAVVGTVVTLGMVVVWLGDREKKEDEKERRRALHAINFQAL